MPTLAALETYDKQIRTCAFCPKMCRFSCPAGNAESSELAHPTGKMEHLQEVRAGRVALDAEQANVFYKCTNCLASRTFCLYRIEVYHALVDARAIAVESGAAPPRVLEIREAIRKNGTHFRTSLAKQLDSILGESPRAGAEGGILLFPGCTAVARTPQAVKDAVHVLAKLEVGPVTVYSHEVPCCGYPMLALGLDAEFREAARRTQAAIRGHDRIVTLDPGCAKTFKIDYPRAGFALSAEVLHVSEFLDGRIGKIRRKKPIPLAGRFVYHDPCHLSRHLGVTEPPRRVLDAVLRDGLGEFSWRREEALCCGGGGGYPLTHPEEARRAAEARLAEIDGGEGTVVVSSCAACERMLSRARRDLPVRNLMSVLAQALGR